MSKLIYLFSILVVSLFWTHVRSELKGAICEKLHLPMCVRGQRMPYGVTGYPNFLNHPNQNSAGLQAHQYFPLIRTNCSPFLRPFICSVFAPSCKSNGTETMLDYPCRALCEAAHSGCNKFMNKFGYIWPKSLECSQFPENGFPCISDFENKTAIPHPTEIKSPVVSVDSSEEVKKEVKEIENIIEQQSITKIAASPLCVPGAYPCPDGRCIPYSWLCDGHFDCPVVPTVGTNQNITPVASDENAFVCALRTCKEKEEFTCPLYSRPKCIPLSKKCDGKPQCTDGADEIGCKAPKQPRVCSETQFQCLQNEHLCVPAAWVCDGTPDCPDWSDEGSQCAKEDRCDEETQFRCSTGNCINKEWKCDGEKDCKHGDDESGCKASRRERERQEVKPRDHPIHRLLKLRFPFTE